MLVLTRKQGETIRISDSIVIKVISCGKGKAKIGIDAPTSVRVIRGELLEALQRNSETLTDLVAEPAHV